MQPLDGALELTTPFSSPVMSAPHRRVRLGFAALHTAGIEPSREYRVELRWAGFG